MSSQQFHEEDHPRNDNGRFAEKGQADPGDTVLAASGGNFSGRHCTLAAEAEQRMYELERQMRAAQGESNRHMLAHFLYDAKVPAGATIELATWPEEADPYGRFDVDPYEVYDADGELLFDMGGTNGALSAGIDGYTGATDWDQFRNEQGRIVADLVYAWAEKARGEEHCPNCDVKHPEAGCADVGCAHNCEAAIQQEARA